MDITPRNYKKKTKNIARRQAGKTTINHRFLVRFVVSTMTLLLLGGLNRCGKTIATTMLLKNQRQTTTTTTTTKLITMVTATTIIRSFSHSHRLFAKSSTFSTSFNPRRHRTISYHDRYSKYEIIRGGCSQHHARQQQPQKLQKSHYYPTKTKTKKQQPKRGIHRDSDSDNGDKKPRRPNKFSKMIRQGTGTMFSVAGFFGSSLISFVTDRRSFQDRFVEPIEALNKFLKTSG